MMRKVEEVMVEARKLAKRRLDALEAPGDDGRWPPPHLVHAEENALRDVYAALSAYEAILLAIERGPAPAPAREGVVLSA